MTSTLDSLSSSLLSNTLPPLFLSRSYPSLRPLSSYFRDLIKRIEMFKNWIISGPPKIFWLPGFFFTQSFFTGVLQNFARKQKISIESMGWKVVVRGDMTFTETKAEKLKQYKKYSQNLVGQYESQDHKNEVNYDEEPFDGMEVGIKGDFAEKSTHNHDKNDEFSDEKLFDGLGVEVNGLWLEGGKWNEQKGRLEDGVEGDVFFNMPEVFLLVYVFYFCL